MGRLDEYRIPLRDMQTLVQQHSFVIDDAFFSAIEAPAVKRGNLSVDLSVRKNIDSFTLGFDIEGSIFVECDRCLEEMELPVSTEGELLVKLGATFSDDNDIIIIPEEEGRIDVSWYIYEFIALEIPIHHVHEDGECDEAMMDYLCRYGAEEANEETTEDTEEKPTDPRWDALKKILKQ